MDKNGFVILRPFLVDKTKVLIWVAQSYRKVDPYEHQKRIDELAREIGANELEFWTVRKGFDRFAPKLGWTRSQQHNEFMIWRKHL